MGFFFIFFICAWDTEYCAPSPPSCVIIANEYSLLSHWFSSQPIKKRVLRPVSWLVERKSEPIGLGGGWGRYGGRLWSCTDEELLIKAMQSMGRDVTVPGVSTALRLTWQLCDRPINLGGGHHCPVGKPSKRDSDLRLQPVLEPFRAPADGLHQKAIRLPMSLMT